MDEFKVQVNVADVPMIKLLRALAREGLAIKDDGKGALTIVEAKALLLSGRQSHTIVMDDPQAPHRAPLTACDLLPGTMTGVASSSETAGA